MTLPITVLTPVVLTNNLDGTGSFYESRTRSKQGKPYTEPAPYSYTFCYVTSAQLYGTAHKNFGGMANASVTPGRYMTGPYYPANYLGTEQIWAVNSAREKLVEKLGDITMMAVNYAERKDAAEMIASRAKQLYKFSRSLKRCDIFGAARALNLSARQIPPRLRKKRRWRRSKDFSDAWLEFHFGWEPLVQDIGACVEILQSPVEPARYTARGRVIRFGEEKAYIPYCGSIPSSRSGTVQASITADFAVANPNLDLANRLGFINPAAVAWELTPFSFVVDWFANVGQFLGQYSEFLGLTVTRSSYSVISRLVCQYTKSYTWAGRLQGYTISGVGVYMTRTLGMPSVKLRLRPLKQVSLVRGATAISLLTQFLGK